MKSLFDIHEMVVESYKFAYATSNNYTQMRKIYLTIVYKPHKIDVKLRNSQPTV